MIAYDTRVKEIVKRALIAAGRRSALVSRAAALIASSDPRRPDTYPYLRDKFVANGASHQVDRNTRLEIVRRFEQIDRCVSISTTPTDGLLLAEMLLNVDASGAVVECGCYAGGSSAKLSIVAKLLGDFSSLRCDGFGAGRHVPGSLDLARAAANQLQANAS